MSLTEQDYTILEKFEFDLPPVGVKFLAKPPSMVDRLDENLALCEMLKRAQEGKAFFADANNHACEAGLYVLDRRKLPSLLSTERSGPACKSMKRRDPQADFTCIFPKSAKALFTMWPLLLWTSSTLSRIY